MKWVYLPILFALAFSYTKFSFNNFKSKTPNNNLIIKRNPASFENQEIKNNSIKRVPTPVLYKHLDDASFLIGFQKVSQFKGLVIGNPYVESFGYIIGDNGLATFNLSDFSDVSVGMYMHDVFGHLVSAKSIDKRISWINYFEAYKNGLQDRPHAYSFYIEKGLQEAISETRKIFDEHVTNDFPFEFTQLGSTHSRVDASKKMIIHNHFKKKFPQSQFFDLYEGKVSKDYQLLVRMRPQDKIQWLSLSESSLGGYAQAFNQQAKLIPFEKRFEILKQDVFDGKINRSLASITIDKKNYIMKFSDHFAAKLSLTQIPADDYQDIILDEAYVLGKIHRTSLGEKSDDYIKAWATIPGAVVDEKMIELKYRLKDFQE